jgi:ABC-type hemin transport system substrate-binding protein
MPAERIVCLMTETTEVVYLLGEQARIVGSLTHLSLRTA